MKWKLLAKYPRFDRWINIKYHFIECFPKGINPNQLL